MSFRILSVVANGGCYRMLWISFFFLWFQRWAMLKMELGRLTAPFLWIALILGIEENGFNNFWKHYYLNRNPGIDFGE